MRVVCVQVELRRKCFSPISPKLEKINALLFWNVNRIVSMKIYKIKIALWEMLSTSWSKEKMFFPNFPKTWKSCCSSFSTKTKLLPWSFFIIKDKQKLRNLNLVFNSYSFLQFSRKILKYKFWWKIAC